MNNLSNVIADFYVKKDIISIEEKEIYQWGLSLIFNDIISFSIILVLSILIGDFKYALLFLLTFCLTRIYCGGYHAKKSYICRLSMVTAFLSVIGMSYPLNNCSIFGLLVIEGLSFVILLPIIPVKHPNKPLPEELRRKNRKKGIISFILFVIGSILLFYLNKQDGIIVALTLFAVSVFALIGVKTNERK